MQLSDRLNRARSGRAVLFCGAGFTADCLNFSDDTIGVSAQLLSIFNDDLLKDGKDSGYKDIRNAAEKFESHFGAPKMMQLLKDKYHIQSVTEDMGTILRYPWSQIYTVNYDNGIERSLTQAQKNHFSLNNTDAFREELGKTPVIHLHGFIDSWNIHNFKSSCILSLDSYLGLPSVNEWMAQFRRDIERVYCIVCRV